MNLSFAINISVDLGEDGAQLVVPTIDPGDLPGIPVSMAIGVLEMAKKMFLDQVGKVEFPKS